MTNCLPDQGYSTSPTWRTVYRATSTPPTWRTVSHAKASTPPTLWTVSRAKASRPPTWRTVSRVIERCHTKMTNCFPGQWEMPYQNNELFPGSMRDAIPKWRTVSRVNERCHTEMTNFLHPEITNQYFINSLLSVIRCINALSLVMYNHSEKGCCWDIRSTSDCV